MVNEASPPRRPRPPNRPRRRATSRAQKNVVLFCRDNRRTRKKFVDRIAQMWELNCKTHPAAPVASGSGADRPLRPAEPAMIDRIDRKILQILQEDCTVPVAEIGRRVGLSTTPCWRRIQKLEEDGVIQRRVAVLDPRLISAKVTAFVSITTNQHSDDWLRRFADIVSQMPEVVEFYRMAGQIDYLLRVVVPDIEAYDAFYKRLIAKIEIADVSTSFAMEQIKYTTAMPLQYIPIEKPSERTAG
jgi:Lrp/AsnC family transcriptional regulator